jgi:hypothetical protein
MSFVPVQVEIMVGSICIGVMPVRFDTAQSGPLGILAYADMFRAECINIKEVSGDRQCEMDFTTVDGTTKWVPEYRVSDFTFGGVMISNPKFDPFRIDAEDQHTLSQKPSP